MRTDNSSKCVYGRDLYVVSLVGTPYFKVGRATDCQKRLRQIQAGSPFEARIVLQFAGAGFREPIAQGSAASPAERRVVRLQPWRDHALRRAAGSSRSSVRAIC